MKFYFQWFFPMCNKHASLPSKTEKFFVREEKKVLQDQLLEFLWNYFYVVLNENRTYDLWIVKRLATLTTRPVSRPKSRPKNLTYLLLLKQTWFVDVNACNRKWMMLTWSQTSSRVTWPKSDAAIPTSAD